MVIIILIIIISNIIRIDLRLLFEIPFIIILIKLKIVKSQYHNKVCIMIKIIYNFIPISISIKFFSFQIMNKLFQNLYYLLKVLVLLYKKT
jgi:hypothetical protein